jgi:exopolysaccharide biosynthesis polyprenyl glycosylphosphotransferase
MSVGALPEQAEETYEQQPERRRPSGASLGPDSVLRRLLATGDALAVLIALLGSLTLGFSPDLGRRLLWGLPALPLMIVLFKLYGLYDRDMRRISYSTADDLPRLFHATVLGTLALWLYSKATPLGQLDFGQALVFGCLTVVLVTLARFTCRHWLARSLAPQRALVVGGGNITRILVGKLAAHPEYRLQVVGLLADSLGGPSAVPEIPAVGSLDDLEQVVKENAISRVIVSPTELEAHELELVLRRCRRLSLQLSLIPSLSDVLGPAVELDEVEGVTVLGVNPPWLPRSSRAIKRGMDVVIAAGLLTLGAPVLVLIAIATKLDSSGHVLFRQERIGKGGKPFWLLKFRTMVSDAEQRRDELLVLSKDPNWLDLETDPRITRVGGWLRRLSLDELPQLWNVLRGEMSLVGPRPLIESEDERVTGWGRGRLDLTPGITGYWQVLGRTRIPFEEMIKLDYLYVMNWSLWEDVRLLLRTLPAVVAGRGAN